MVNFGSIFEHGGKMTATDWVVDVVVAAGAFGFGCLQLVLAVNLLIPDETLRRMLGIEAGVRAHRPRRHRRARRRQAHGALGLVLPLHAVLVRAPVSDGGGVAAAHGAARRPLHAGLRT